ncbi:acyl-coenzyme A thioesterase 1-like [Gasterosteus aculeatus]
MSSQVRLSLLPRARCMFDEPVQVKVAGLRSGQMVTLRARSTDEKGVLFSSSATFRADGSGQIDLERDPSLGGTYTGEGPFPAVLDLYTSGGGLSEKRPSLLASRGPQVGSKGVGVISLSKSGDLALSMASYLQGVEAVVWINGCSANTLLPLYYQKSQILPALMIDLSKLIPTESEAFNGKKVMNDPLAEENEATLIPVERAEGRLLFVASEDDLNWDSTAYVDMMVERLQRHRKDNFEIVCYPGAGHILEPPYGPYCPSSLHAVVGSPVLLGGEAWSHAAAEVHLWEKIQEFFRTHLSCDATQTKAKL